MGYKINHSIIRKNNTDSKKTLDNIIRIKASFTVEAAVIVPLILFTIAGVIDTGYGMFQEAKAAVEIEEELTKLDQVDIVRNMTFIQQNLKEK